MIATARPTAATLIFALALMGGACAPQGAESVAERNTSKPNIVLIVADDLGWTDLGAYGSGYYETPNIDALARDGLKFSSAYANPNCAPTRSALMTGRYSPRTGIYTVQSGDRGLEEFRKMRAVENQTELPLNEVTFAEMLREAGYRTATMGKWHLGKGEHMPENQGFDVNFKGDETGSPRDGYFDEQGRNLTDSIANEAVKFINSNRDEPFLLYLPFYAVHTPLQAKPELIQKYEAKAPVEGHGDPTYAAMIETLDDAVGLVLGALDTHGLAEDTVVFFYSDNGGVGGYQRAGVDSREITDNAPLRGGKGMLYEGGVRVPLIVRWPNVTPPSALTIAPVMCVDFFPTLLDIAGVPLPDDRPIDGASFMDVIRTGRALEPRPPIFWHFPGYLQGNEEVGAWRTTPTGALRAENYKLIEFFEDGRTELYNLEEDIAEQVDLTSVEPERSERMKAMIADWRIRLDAPMPERK